MENATKALLMAAGILIGIIVITIGVVLFVNYKKIGSSYEQQLKTAEITKYNSNFTKFEGRDNITIYEIISIAKFATEKQNGEIETKVKLGEEDITNIDSSTQDYKQMITPYITDYPLKVYKVSKVSYNEDTGYIDEIEFVEK